MTDYDYDCIVLGTGNAALCSALSAVESGCDPTRVLLIDRAPRTWAGGNSYFTAGAFRVAHAGVADLVEIARRGEEERAAETKQSRLDKIDIDPYTEEQFVEDIVRLGGEGAKHDMELVRTLVRNSKATVQWLAESMGIRYEFATHRQAYEVDGRIKFWGGLSVAARGGGKGLVEGLMRKADQVGVSWRWGANVVELIVQGEGVRGVRVVDGVTEEEGEVLTARAVILAAGGFEANKDMRVKYLGPGWDKAHVRGTPYNQGDGFTLALNLPSAIKPELVGDWAGCHATCWDFNSPADAGDRDTTNAYTKSGYPLGLMLNAHGQRYVDEGADFRNYTYAVYGRATLLQPGGFAFQVWDRKGREMLRTEEYGEGITQVYEAGTIEELAEKLVGEGLLDTCKGTFVETVREYNEAVRAFQAEYPGRRFDPSIKDGCGTQSSKKKLEVPKSNWARELEEGPFTAVKITCGVTFTFGGLGVDAETAGVLKASREKRDERMEERRTIDGLFCAGEMVGNLYWGNYPGGSGLTAGAVFGRMAGKEIGRLVRGERQRMR